MPRRRTRSSPTSAAGRGATPRSAWVLQRCRHDSNGSPPAGGTPPPRAPTGSSAGGRTVLWVEQRRVVVTGAAGRIGSVVRCAGRSLGPGPDRSARCTRRMAGRRNRGGGMPRHLRRSGRRRPPRGDARPGGWLGRPVAGQPGQPIRCFRGRGGPEVSAGWCSPAACMRCRLTREGRQRRAADIPRPANGTALPRRGPRRWVQRPQRPDDVGGGAAHRALPPTSGHGWRATAGEPCRLAAGWDASDPIRVAVESPDVDGFIVVNGTSMNRYPAPTSPRPSPWATSLATTLGPSDRPLREGPQIPFWFRVHTFSAFCVRQEPPGAVARRGELTY